MTETETEPTDGTVAQPTSHADDVRTYLYWGALAGFVLLAIAATMQLYASGTRAIRI